MARIETWLRCDLQAMVRVQEMEGDLFSADNQANRIGVIVTDHGRDVALSGSVTGYVIRPDEATVVVLGQLDGNRAWIDLPASAYVHKGPISIVVKLGTTTIAACHGYMKRSTTDTIVDPGHVIPSISDLLSEIDNMRTATAAANTAAGSANSAASDANVAAANANNKASEANAAATKINGMTVVSAQGEPGLPASVTLELVDGHYRLTFTNVKGATGEAFHIVKTYESVSQMEADYSGTDTSIGDYVMVVNSVEDPDNAKVYIKGSTAWQFVVDMSGATGLIGPKGDKGDPGDATIDDTAGSGDTTMVWSADKLTNDVVKPLREKAESDNLYSYKNVSGNPVIVEDAVADAVKSMRIEIAPVQNLHGYENPWVGGAGKNKLPTVLSSIKLANTSGTWNNNTYTVSGVTITVVTDENDNVLGFKVNGTASATIGFVTSSSMVGMFSDGDEFLYSGCSNGSLSTYKADIFCRTDRTYTPATNYNGDTSFSVNSEVVGAIELYSRIVIYSGYVASDLMFYPMLRLATETDDTFAPYSNICPISGWTECKVTDANGSNIFSTTGITANNYNSEVTINSPTSITVSSNGSGTYQSSKQLLSNYNLVAGKKYTIMARIVKNTQDSTALFGIRNSSNAFVVMDHDYNSSDPYETEIAKCTFVYDPSIHSYMSFIASWDVAKNDASVTYENIYFCEGDGNRYHISFGQTVYGGELTINRDGTGSMVADLGIYTIDSEHTLGVYGTASNLTFCTSATSIKKVETSDIDKFISNMFKAHANSSVGTMNCEFTVNAENKIIVRAPNLFTTVNEANAYFATNPMQVVAPLANPIVINLTAPQVQLLMGYNTVYADTGAILSMLYPVEKYQTAEQADRERIHIVDSTAEPVKTLTDGADGVPMGIQFAVEPKQDLHGQSSPYPAGGGKNLLPMTLEGIKACNTNSTWTGNSTLISGITYTVLTDNDGNVIGINANGTAGSGAYLNLFNGTIALAPGSYSSLVSDTEHNVNLQLRISSVSGNDIMGSATRSKRQNTISESVSVIGRLSISNSNVISNITVYPMLAMQSEELSESTFDPYSNICPISGWTEGKLTGTGELFETSVASAYITTDGKFTESNTGSKSVVASVTAGTIVINKNQSSVFRIGLFSSSPSNGQQATSYETVDATETQHTITVQNDCYMAVFAVSSSSQTDIADSDAIINSIVVAKNAITTYTIQLGSTVYGGKLTVNKDGTGSMIVDRQHGKVGELGFAYLSSNRFRIQNATAIKTPANNNTNANIICSAYRTSTYNKTYDRNVDFAIGLSTAKTLIIYDKRFDNITDFNAANANTDIVYELAEPFTIPLSAPQVKSLLGVNNLYADTGNILSVDYSADTKLYVEGVKNEVSETQGMISESEIEQSSNIHFTGDIFVHKNALYQATEYISRNETLVPGSNIKPTSLAEQLTPLITTLLIVNDDDTFDELPICKIGKIRMVNAMLHPKEYDSGFLMDLEDNYPCQKVLNYPAHYIHTENNQTVTESCVLRYTRQTSTWILIRSNGTTMALGISADSLPSSDRINANIVWSV